MPTTTEMVDVIFTKLSLYYGRDFMSRWEGLDMGLVKGDWAHELAGVSPAGIKYALQNLPIRPPHVGEFRLVALRAPVAPALRLEAPRSNRAFVEAELSKARAILKNAKAGK